MSSLHPTPKTLDTHTQEPPSVKRPDATPAPQPLNLPLETPELLSRAQILTLQRSVGNRAVAQLFQGSASRVLQRARTKASTSNRAATARRNGVSNARPIRKDPQAGTADDPKKRATVSFNTAKDEIVSVSFKNARRPRTTGSKQGDHGTSYVMITQRIMNQFRKTALSDFQTNVQVLVREMEAIPQLANMRGKGFARQVLDNAIALAANVDAEDTTPGQIGTVLFQLAEAWNAIPGGAVVHATSTGGHNEAGHRAILNAAALQLQQGRQLAYSNQDIIKSIWGQFDYVAGANAKPETIAGRVERHIRHMNNTYKDLVTRVGGISALVTAFDNTYATNTFSSMKTKLIEKRRAAFRALRKNLGI